jgi:hypothetical protein
MDVVRFFWIQTTTQNLWRPLFGMWFLVFALLSQSDAIRQVLMEKSFL